MYNRIYKRIKKILSPAFFLLLLFTIVLSNVTTVFASSSDEIPDAVYDSSESVVHLVLSCTDSNGDTYYIHQGTGFVAGTSDGTQYILTTNQITTASESQLNQIRKWGGLSSDEKLTTQISVLLESEVLLPATVVSTGTSIPYALLTIEQPLKDVSAPKYRYSGTVTRNQAAYSYCYDSNIQALSQTLPNLEASFKSGSITNISTDPLMLSSDITAESGSAGAPVFDKDGLVIGMLYASNGNMEILPSDSIMSIFDALNVDYSTNAGNSDYNVADKTTKQALKDLLSECQQDVIQNEERYSSKTLTAYKEAINSAMEVIENTDSTKDDYDTCISDLKKAKSKLKPKNFTLHIVQLILGAVLLLLLFINVRQYLNSIKLYHTLHPELAPKDQSKKSAALIRVNTNEVIWLTTKELRIGSDSGMVDYLITNNSAISRYHAAVIQKRHQYYIIDNNSTNHTSVNHTVLASDKPCELHDNDTILLADEPFIFCLMEP